MVRWSPEAISDRKAAIAYLRPRNRHAAKRLLSTFISAARSLERFPDRGRQGDAPDTRELVVVPTYIMIYKVDHAADTVTILRIWHAAQDR